MQQKAEENLVHVLLNDECGEEKERMRYIEREKAGKDDNLRRTRCEGIMNLN